MNTATYLNHRHYITEGWSAEPKETFKALVSLLRSRRQQAGLRVLDVGCATGELLAFIASQLEVDRLVGVDVADDLVTTASELLPTAEFVRASALDLPEDMTGEFDVVLSLGCMSIFDENEIDLFWANLLRCARSNGLVVVLSPLNEFGVDAIIRHRKRMSGSPGPWEKGWNVFSAATIREIVSTSGQSLELARFEMPFDLDRRPDPIRTWTRPMGAQQRQLTNGLKLLIDHYFMIVDRRADAGA